MSKQTGKILAAGVGTLFVTATFANSIDSRTTSPTHSAESKGESSYRIAANTCKGPNSCQGQSTSKKSNASKEKNNSQSKKGKQGKKKKRKNTQQHED